MRRGTYGEEFRSEGGRILRFFLLPVIVVLIMMSGVQSAYGYTAVNGTVTCTSGIVRKDASTSSACVFCVSKDESVTITDEKKDSSGTVWYQIKMGENTGYIRSDLVKKSTTKTSVVADANSATATTASASSGVSGKVKSDNTIMRLSASKTGDIATTINKDTEITASKAVDGEDGKEWYYVTAVKNGIIFKGYIRNDLVTMSGKVPKELKTENTEEQKTDDSNAEENKAKEENTGDNAAEQTPQTAGKTQIGKVKASGVNVRKEPVNGEVVGRVTTGQSVTVTDYTTAADGNVWFKISFIYNLQALSGYIRSDFVEGITIEEAAKEEPAEEKPAEPEVQTPPVTWKGVLKGSAVRIRESAVSGPVVAQLNNGHALVILDEKNESDGYKWYQVQFAYQGSEKTGYVRSDFVSIISTPASTVALSDEEFENAISSFPESYKPSLRILHEQYPGWQFQAVNTGLEWNDALARECAVGKNLVSKNSVSSWKSTEPQAYSWSNNAWYTFDGGSWVSASRELIAYYMDPRNFLTDSGIFQFETLSYQDYQNEAGVNAILAGSFMGGEYTDTDGVTRSYATTFVEAGRAAGISPYHLASRCLQEQGTTGTMGVSGTVGGMENHFNFFNIGAYAANGNTAIINGLIYAMGADENYMRPWNSRYRSIVGSAKYVSEKYVNKGQNTLYFQKFNVVNSENGIYSHQYMSNILAAASEATRMKKAYTDLNTSLVFRIPVYNNMPETMCEKPFSDSNPNNYLSALWVDGKTIAPGFNSSVFAYGLVVDGSVETINIGATPVVGSTTVAGTGTVRVENGTNTYNIVCKSQNGNTRTYTLVVQKN